MEMKRNINQKMKFRMHGAFVEINPQDLPMEMDVEIFLDLGENSNANTLQKLQQLGNARYSEDIAARKYVTGQEYWQGSVSQDLYPLEANREVTVTECWLRVDRDGDGAEYQSKDEVPYAWGIR